MNDVRAAMASLGYRPYSELPPDYKDGRLVLLGNAETGYDYPMRWSASRGRWEMDDLSWTEGPDGGPTHFRPKETIPETTGDTSPLVILFCSLCARLYRRREMEKDEIEITPQMMLHIL